jgi:nicotinamidase-related amidase
MKLEPEKTAVVLIEFQNDFTSEGGALHGAAKAFGPSSSVLL